MDILLVRKDAPVQRMRLGPWLLYFVLLLICLTVAGLGAGGYLLYQQNQALKELIQSNRRMQLVSRNLESLLRDLQDRAVLSAQPPVTAPTVKPPDTAPPPAKTVAPKMQQPAAEPATATEPKPEPKPAPPRASSQPEPSPAAAAPKPAPDPGPESGVASQAQGLEPWPTTCEWVDIRKISTKKTRRELFVYFNVTNKQESKKPAEGYVAVILRGERKGAPWLEAWPPTRLTPLGRPENFKRTAAFEVRRYRRLRARFAMVDKDVELLEFLVYTKEGDLALLVRHPLGSGKKKS